MCKLVNWYLLITSVVYFRLVGDVLLATGFLSYSGPFNQEFRNLLQESWKKEMRKAKIPFSEVWILICITNWIVIVTLLHHVYVICDTLMSRNNSRELHYNWLLSLRSCHITYSFHGHVTFWQGYVTKHSRHSHSACHVTGCFLDISIAIEPHNIVTPPSCHVTQP